MHRTRKLLPAAVAVVLALGLGLWSAHAGQKPHSGRYKVLAPISSGNLTVFPVVAAGSHNTNEFLTLDEGLHSGEVVVTEAGRVEPLMRRRPRPYPVPLPDRDRAQVNRLVLVNNSKRPLILLAGEILTGGKQDRVVGKDRIVPPDSDPIDVSVFCVEPGRWTARSDKFHALGVQMAQPKIRARAMADKNQQAVWDEVSSFKRGAVAAAPAAAEVASVDSYAEAVSNSEVQRRVEAVAEPIRRNYESLMRELRARNAVGVVVAIGGQVVWADIFASTSLLDKYWPKLVRSYAAEAFASRAGFAPPEQMAAQAFIDNLEGTRQVVESEPGVYRHAEISGPGFRAFELTSLLPKTGFELHIAKMAE